MTLLTHPFLIPVLNNTVFETKCVGVHNNTLILQCIYPTQKLIFLSLILHIVFYLLFQNILQKDIISYLTIIPF